MLSIRCPGCSLLLTAPFESFFDLTEAVDTTGQAIPLESLEKVFMLQLLPFKQIRPCHADRLFPAADLNCISPAWRFPWIELNPFLSFPINQLSVSFCNMALTIIMLFRGNRPSVYNKS